MQESMRTLGQLQWNLHKELNKDELDKMSSCESSLSDLESLLLV
jgi:hypothetical protein